MKGSKVLLLTVFLVVVCSSVLLSSKEGFSEDSLSSTSIVGIVVGVLSAITVLFAIGMETDFSKFFKRAVRNVSFNDPQPLNMR